MERWIGSIEIGAVLLLEAGSSTSEKAISSLQEAR
jgi:hypothetical protein